MSLEELTKKKQLYENVKEILERVIDSFSSINFNDDILCAKRALSSYFYINDEDLYTSKITGIGESINTNVDKLKELCTSIDLELEKVKNEILSAELTGGM